MPVARPTDKLGGRRQHPHGWTHRPNLGASARVGTPPPYASRVKGGVQKSHIFDKHDQGEGGAEMSPPSKDPVTGWPALRQGLIHSG